MIMILARTRFFRLLLWLALTNTAVNTQSYEDNDISTFDITHGIALIPTDPVTGIAVHFLYSLVLPLRTLIVYASS